MEINRETYEERKRKIRESEVIGETGVRMYMLNDDLWYYEIDQTQIPLETLNEIEKLRVWSELTLSAKFRRPTVLFFFSTEPLPPRRCMSISCIGSKPELHPDQVVELLKNIVTEIKEYPIWK